LRDVVRNLSHSDFGKNAIVVEKMDVESRQTLHCNHDDDVEKKPAAEEKRMSPRRRTVNLSSRTD